MSRQRRQGSSLESAAAEYFGDLGDVIREPLHGARDVGDIHGLYIDGLPVVVECKHYGGKYKDLSEWIKELEAEMANAGTPYGFLIIKRYGKGIPESTGAQYTATTARTMKALIRAATKEEEMPIYNHSEARRHRYVLADIVRELEAREREMAPIEEYAERHLMEDCFSTETEPKDGETFEEWEARIFRNWAVPAELSAAQVFGIVGRRLHTVYREHLEKAGEESE